MIQFTVSPSFPTPKTDFRLGHRLLEADMTLKLCQEYGHRFALMVDAALQKTWGEKLARQWNAELFIIPSGESSKTREMKQQIEDSLLQKKYGRDTLLIALGGGVTTDLVGFVASTFLRGVPLLLIPTTLLGMVDAAIGGKNGIDTPQGKNLIGSFYPPKAIVCDLETLKTLPDKEWLNGFAEILKTGLIADSSIWELGQKNWRSIENLEKIIEKTVRAKVITVQQDPHEHGLRRILNFGHTVGHALESISQFHLPHGQAIALGLIIESYLSMRLNYLAPSDFAIIQETITKAGFSLRLPSSYERTRFLDALSFDKKKAQGAIRFTLLEKIGKAHAFQGEYCMAVSNTQLDEMILWMEKNYG